MTTLNRAIAVAAEAHAGQTDKAGLPYILHPIRVMLRMKNNDQRIVAVLHDLLEDCPDWSMNRLSDEGFSTPVVTAIGVLTRLERQSYADYVALVARDPLATAVKLGDLADNLDPSRPSTALLPAATVEKYMRAQTTLLAVQSRQEAVALRGSAS